LKFPVTMTHPDSKNPKKTLRARTQEELDGLLRIGWIAQQEPNTIEGIGKAQPVADLVKRG
jgi:hypothetical protein